MSTGCYWNSVEGTPLQSASSYLSLVQAAGQVVLFPHLMKTDYSSWVVHHDSLIVWKVKTRKVYSKPENKESIYTQKTSKQTTRKKKINRTPEPFPLSSVISCYLAVGRCVSIKGTTVDHDILKLKDQWQRTCRAYKHIYFMLSQLIYSGVHCQI